MYTTELIFDWNDLTTVNICAAGRLLLPHVAICLHSFQNPV